MNKTISYYDSLFKGAATSTFEKAKILRQEKTETEEILWRFLRNKKIDNCKFRRQHVLSCYIADFYCHERKLVIEIDGGYHNEKEQKELDEARTNAINEYCIDVIRFTNKEVKNNIKLVIEKITRILKEKTKNSTPLHVERGRGEVHTGKNKV
ncbi:MAG: endonuclease domain-containing protein [Ignavibacteriae bacterium]|nr:MAG: endonuclease domain-containing protein [Ignavibacteriota bacterium]